MVEIYSDLSRTGLWRGVRVKVCEVRITSSEIEGDKYSCVLTNFDSSHDINWYQSRLEDGFLAKRYSTVADRVSERRRCTASEKFKPQITADSIFFASSSALIKTVIAALGISEESRFNLSRAFKEASGIDSCAGHGKEEEELKAGDMPKAGPGCG